MAEWAERRGVLVKAIEDTALGVASVYRSIELPLPKQLPYASKDIRREWAELLARFMPFDLVIDEHTADGQEARVSKTSVAGSWGAVAGSLRFFADRFGVPRASIEGTTLSYDLVREHATLGAPRVVLSGPRKHQGLAVERRRSYFGFELDTEVEPLRDGVPEPLRDTARGVLAEALIEGETAHPDQGRLRRAVETLDELWRRSGGTLDAAAPNAVRSRLRAQLERVIGWDDFLRTRVQLDPGALIDEATRSRLEELPSMIRLRGDAAPLDYEVADGTRRGARPASGGPGQAPSRGRPPAPRPAAPLRRGPRAVISPFWPTAWPTCMPSCGGHPSRPVTTTTELIGHDLARVLRGCPGPRRHGRSRRGWRRPGESRVRPDAPMCTRGRGGRLERVYNPRSKPRRQLPDVYL